VVKAIRAIACVLVALAAVSTPVAAQCCPGYELASSCASVTLTKSRLCIQDTVPSGQNALPEALCAYGDKVISTLEEVFNIPAKEIFEFQLDAQTGGAHTGTSCDHLGDGVAYDAFVGSAYGAKGFWGYLLSLHEALNDWTGMASPGWPTDWWADHQSAFPNLMDFHVMQTIGMANDDQNLIKAAAAQKKRFYPGGDSADPKVVALDNVFAAMPNGDGFAGFSEMFAMHSADGVKWDGLGVRNPDVKRSEYVVAYMSLAARKPVLESVQGPGANGGGGICNGTPDGTAGDAPYTCSAANIAAIASAHCAVVANGRPSTDRAALRSGAYAMVSQRAMREQLSGGVCVRRSTALRRAVGDRRRRRWRRRWWSCWRRRRLDRRWQRRRPAQTQRHHDRAGRIRRRKLGLSLQRSRPAWACASRAVRPGAARGVLAM
jgi:hypothetical protein